jgi:hypothetical protein
VKLTFKEGVAIKGLQPQMLVALLLAKQVFDELGVDTTVTSGSDGEHMEGSKHYTGLAWDFRTHHTGRAEAVARELTKVLKPLGFDVVLEALGSFNEHIHVEYDPHA